MIRGANVLFSPVFLSSFPRFPRKRPELFRLILAGRFAALDSSKERKAKNTLALQEKFLSSPPSPFAAAFTAHPFKGRSAFRSASLHYTLDLLARLRLPLLTTAAPREIPSQSRRLKKAKNTVRILRVFT